MGLFEQTVDGCRSGPTVSVIIPTYNAAQFVREAVESTLGQTHPPMEVIVVDGHSTDDTMAVLEPFRDRVRIVTQPNRGLAEARNVGAEASRGDWLAFLDADDYWSPEKLERQLLHADSECEMIYSDRFNVGDRGILPEVLSQLFPLYEGDIFIDLLVQGNRITVSSVLMRRSTFQALGGFFTELPGAEDWDLWIRYAADREVRVCREPLVSYRLHPNNLSRNPRIMWSGRRTVIRRALRSPRGRSLPPSLRRRIWSRTWLSNGSDAARNGYRLRALVAYLRAACYWPFDARPYKESLKACLGLN